ncbi:MAG TPA: hypothetical protein VFK13_08890 [Gemmatimonadaceae bacterium]|nr:hypothetical protein [Gemmatimonadaceae bacterium]
MRKTMLAAAAAVLVAAGAAGQARAQQMRDDMHGAAMSPPAMSAADLRVALNNLLAEHVQLGSAATSAALGGRTAEFQAAAAALDQNSVALSKAIGLVYGADAESAFLALWRRHIGFVVDYTQGVAAKDRAKADKALQDLTGYARDFAAFLSSANPNLPAPVVAELVRTHAGGFKAIIDAQARGDETGAYRALHDAVAHMQAIADPLAAGIAKQFPKRFAM